jgi:hypothetical protein
VVGRFAPLITRRQPPAMSDAQHRVAKKTVPYPVASVRTSAPPLVAFAGQHAELVAVGDALVLGERDSRRSRG